MRGVTNNHNRMQVYGSIINWKMKETAYFFIFSFLIATSCNVPTQQEGRIIRILNDRYTDYHFSTDNDYLGINLKLNLIGSKWGQCLVKKDL